MKTKWPTFGLLVACVLLLIVNVALTRRVRSLTARNAELASSEAPAEGSFLRRIEGRDLSNQATAIDFSARPQQTLLMVLSPMCRYCADNWGYWRELLHSSTGVGVVFADTSGEADLGYFQKLGISPPLEAVRLGLQTKLTYKLNTTPTTVLLGPKGRVKGVWVGVLSSDEMHAIRRKLAEE